MAIVVLLRHGRTAANAEGTLAGRRPVGLDEAGVRQAVDLRGRLLDLSPALAAVVTSPLARCRQTVSLALPDATAEIDDRLTECGYGDWTGQPLATLRTDPLWRVVQTRPSVVTFPGPGGESISAMSARAVAAIRDWDERVTRSHGQDAVWLACGHGDVIKAIVADALGMHLDLFQRVVVEPASISVIRYVGHRPFLMRLNDVGDRSTGFTPPRRREADHDGQPAGTPADTRPTGAPARPIGADAIVGSDAVIGGGA